MVLFFRVAGEVYVFVWHQLSPESPSQAGPPRGPPAAADAAGPKRDHQAVQTRCPVLSGCSSSTSDSVGHCYACEQLFMMPNHSPAQIKCFNI